MDNRIDSILTSDRLFVIAGPCVAESPELLKVVANRLVELADEFDVGLIFKSSYTKANRLSGDSYTGPGLEQGLKALDNIKREFDLPILTDVHETVEVNSVAEVADVIQIPAFLCRQTELARAARQTGKWVNIKKGQFLAPEDMTPLVEKIGSKKTMVTERGSSFGYRNLVVDFRSLIIMRETGAKVVFDATHSLQLPGAAGAAGAVTGASGGVSGGQPEFSIPLARAAVAVGIDGLFVETHPDPANARSDAAAMLPLDKMGELLREVCAIHSVRKGVQLAEV